MKPRNYMDGGRGFVICSGCRQKLHTPTIDVDDPYFKIQCPACKTVNLAQACETMDVREHGKLSYLLEQLVKFGRKSIPVENGSAVQRESLNCKPSPLKAPKPSSLDGRPKKRALLIGVSYKKWKYKLKGTINDVKNMRDMLIEHFSFRLQNILVLTEDETDQELTPTKRNIQNSLEWLVEGCKAGDSLVFYFSGHGLRQPDFNEDEIDGFDETILPVDFMEEGMIIDNYINSTIVWPLTEGVTLHAIIDACHSGTMLDLLHVYNVKAKKWDDNKPPSGVRKHSNGGLAISISACEDNQVALDTTAFSRKEMGGALTCILIDLVKRHPGLTYGDLIELMHEVIDEANRNGCVLTRFFKLVFHGRILQGPLAGNCTSSTLPAHMAKRVPTTWPRECLLISLYFQLLNHLMSSTNILSCNHPRFEVTLDSVELFCKNLKL
ncbi:hypothetical protein K2173_012733 [Erythroxylum novogranatense]|uniref:Peptidase C14 caspase domain-containing protein n=1 Tax=Erythroxylum novogranatense TaxID=1862640 RepID=A0AAV8SS87_9ROSI|nr:hypothetical protein K2173_012733 [Erythroxylum novogranatense]